MLRNLYISGPDGARKSTTARLLKDYLETWGEEAEVFHFPQVISPASYLIEQVRSGRLEIPRSAVELLFVADRLDAAAQFLRKERERNPDIKFIFDRGTLDGAVYTAAFCQTGWDPMETARWVERCDEMFLKEFPVDFGLLLLPTAEEAHRRMKQRTYDKSDLPDNWDSDISLQQRLIQIFPLLVEQRPEWNVVHIRPDGDSFKSTEQQIIRIVSERVIREGRTVLTDEGQARLGIERY